jgi:hypothetical protein
MRKTAKLIDDLLVRDGISGPLCIADTSDQLDRKCLICALLAQGPYLLGAEFSAADLMLIMLMRWSRNMPRPATEWPALQQYAARMKARPSWKKLYALEGLSEWS